MRIVMLVAVTAALGACSNQGANGSGNAANGSANKAGANAASTATNSASASAAARPAEGYRRYFDERWARGGAPVTPEEVAAMLRTQTPQQTVNALYGNGENSRWDTVASGIAKGEPAWLALAPQISRGTDAGTSVDFAVAAQDALTTNPTGALRMLGQTEMSTGACGENGIEVPAEQARAFHQAAIASVQSVNDPALQQIKEQCLAALREDQAKYPR